ncbi:THUMP-like domain-containing protein [Changchengzhania lutea]|uniref:THUMP-like domain-containing protein n=1 Tax=Changchengzhania lutea TaxID=2049305 RepID=UPI00115E88B3|nr:class I SAM-dependent methyltransferase [Changchengzhania lutea]
MNKDVLNSDVQEYINNKINDTISDLALKGTSFVKVNTKEIIEQIEAKKHSEHKLPTWFHSKNIYYPNKLNIEQTSSERTAQYKASCISGTYVVDVTGGFGVDAYYFSKKTDKVIHCEIDSRLSAIVAHNYGVLKVDNIQAINEDGIQFVKNSKIFFDWIYIDPSRRHNTKGKVFLLKDCLPKVPEHLAMLFEHTNNIMIKTSPLLDISMGLNELKNVKTIHVVAVNNDVKELLWVLEKGHTKGISIQTINFKKNEEEQFHFNFEDEKQDAIILSHPLAYLYEPNSAILKAGGFNSIAIKLVLSKLHKHSHLYTSDDLLDFPGRVFKVLKSIPYNKRTLKKAGFYKANITTRNFPESVEQIRKKFKIVHGGDLYLFFSTNLNNEKIILVCNKP